MAPNTRRSISKLRERLAGQTLTRQKLRNLVSLGYEDSLIRSLNENLGKASETVKKVSRAILRRSNARSQGSSYTFQQPPQYEPTDPGSLQAPTALAETEIRTGSNDSDLQAPQSAQVATAQSQPIVNLGIAQRFDRALLDPARFHDLAENDDMMNFMETVRDYVTYLRLGPYGDGNWDQVGDDDMNVAEEFLHLLQLDDKNDTAFPLAKTVALEFRDQEAHNSALEVAKEPFKTVLERVQPYLPKPLPTTTGVEVAKGLNRNRLGRKLEYLEFRMPELWEQHNNENPMVGDTILERYTRLQHQFEQMKLKHQPLEEEVSKHLNTIESNLHEVASKIEVQLKEKDRNGTEENEGEDTESDMDEVDSTVSESERYEDVRSENYEEDPLGTETEWSED